MDGISDEPVRFCSPDYGDIFIGDEAAEGIIQAASDVIGVEEVHEMRPELLMAIVVEALNYGFCDAAVHALYLTIGLGGGLGKAMIDIVRLTDHIEPHLRGVCSASIARLRTIVRQSCGPG